jgi:hypothetical protein
MTDPRPELLTALAVLDIIDGIVDDTHPEGDGCPLCVALDDLREAAEHARPPQAEGLRAALAEIAEASRDAIVVRVRYANGTNGGATDEQVDATTKRLLDATQAAYAALRAEATRDGLDAAWAEAEAALPEGWHILTVVNTSGEPWSLPTWRAMAGEYGPDSPYRASIGHTPAAALRALAAALSPREDET